MFDMKKREGFRRQISKFCLNLEAEFDRDFYQSSAFVRGGEWA